MKWSLIVVLTAFGYSDFSLTYRIDNKIIQTTYYKDRNHTLFEYKEGNKTLQELIILDDKRYIKFSENGKTKVYELNSSSDSNNTISANSKSDFELVEVQENGGYDFKTQKWIIKKGDKNETLIVSNDKKIYPKVHEMVSALKTILPKKSINEADIFELKGGYALIKSKKVELLSHNEKELELSKFQLEIQNKINKKVSQEIDRCSMHICCGETKKIEPSKELKEYIKNSDWKILNVARCNSEIKESAILTNGDDYIVVELKDREQKSKIEDIKNRGVGINRVEKEQINGYMVNIAYIPQLDLKIEDINLPTKVLSIYTKDDINLKDFTKNVIDLKKTNNYKIGVR